MKTKIVYVLVSTDDDIYLEQAFVSMYSLREYNPDAYIILLTDDLTEKSLVGKRRFMVDLANEIVVARLDHNLNGQKRSRQLKTSVRNRIDGDYLFIDCDTIIVKSLEDIDSVEGVIAACRDTHCSLDNNPYKDMCIAHGHLLGWPIDDEKDYFNSGVIYVKDVPETHEFYKRWNDNLNVGYHKKVFMDQPSFAKTNYELGHIIFNLDDVWNCQLKHGIRYLRDAIIVHYLTTNPSFHQNTQLFLLNEQNSLLEIKRTGKVNEKIKEVIKDPFNGLAEVTHCFAGKDIFFFRTESYDILRRNYRPNVLTPYDYALRIIDRIEKMYTKLRR